LSNIIDKVIEINGTLTVENNDPYHPFSIQRCTLKMGTNSSIIVKGNGNFLLTNCKIFACNKLWNGITVQQNGKISFSSNELEDAITAITIDRPKYSSIDGSTFNRNYNGVEILQLNQYGLSTGGATISRKLPSNG
jgi:hypothetical protein